jgi:arylsulfatase A-like enzyme/Flp pilus assembly protein TadD
MNETCVRALEAQAGKTMTLCKKSLRLASVFLLIFFILAGSFSFWKKCEGSAPRKNKNNILLITIDTLRPDRLSCYSKKYGSTPHIDALAQRGATFTKAMAHTPTTLPSHTNILLGTTPLHHGVRSNSMFLVPQHFLTLAEHLKGEGYATGAFVGSYVLDSRVGLNQGFDVYDDFLPDRSSSPFASAGYAERKAEDVIQSARKWLSRQSSQWFCWIHIWDPHAPYSPPPPFEASYAHDPYSGEVAYVDKCLGEFFDALRNKNLTDRTHIVLTGDHGESLGEHNEMTHGHFAYNSTLWIPLILAGPKVTACRIDQYVTHTDIFPTICDLVGIDKPANLQGLSLLSLTAGKKAPKRMIYFESMSPYYDRGWAPLKGYFAEDIKFMDSPIPEIYDVVKDFSEKNNLAAGTDLNPYRKRLKDLEDRYGADTKTERQKTIDPKAMAKLRSLGYIATSAPMKDKIYGPEDDLKTLILFEDKLYRAMALYEEGRTEESIRILKSIITQRADFDSAYISLAKIYESRGQLKKALGTMEEGYAKNPANFEILAKYGKLCVRAGLYENAEIALKQALAIVDFDPAIWNQLGIVYMRTKQEKRARDLFNKSLELDKNNAEALNNLGVLFLGIARRTKDSSASERAIQNLERAVSLDPNSHIYLNGLGSAYKIGGRLDEAIDCWERALGIKHDYPLSVVNLGIVYFQKGDKIRSLEHLNRYLRLKGDSMSPNERKRIESLIQRAQQLD